MTAKQTAMAVYGFTEWPTSRTDRAADCKGLACKLMRSEGMFIKVVAHEVGFADASSVLWSIKRLEQRRVE
jgi:hypothetical protein